MCNNKVFKVIKDFKDLNDPNLTEFTIILTDFHKKQLYL